VVYKNGVKPASKSSCPKSTPGTSRDASDSVVHMVQGYGSFATAPLADRPSDSESKTRQPGSQPGSPPPSPENPEPPHRRSAGTEWRTTPLGARLEARERELVAACLPRLYNPVCVQVGSLDGADVLAGTEASIKVLVDDSDGPDPDSGILHVRGSSAALPFAERSVDLAVLAHSLDFSRDPHQALREVDQVLTGDGHVVIVGFNPFSLWGFRSALSNLSARILGRERTSAHRSPWRGRWLRPNRVQDWLALLGYEVTAGRRSEYGLPIQSKRLAERLGFLDRAGDRWWPRLGGVYVVVARKREMIGTLADLRRPRRRRIGRKLATPATRRSQTGRPTLRVVK